MTVKCGGDFSVRSTEVHGWRNNLGVCRAVVTVGPRGPGCASHQTPPAQGCIFYAINEREEQVRSPTFRLIIWTDFANIGPPTYWWWPTKKGGFQASHRKTKSGPGCLGDCFVSSNDISGLRRPKNVKFGTKVALTLPVTLCWYELQETW